jgi:O-acetyl-ADP-ribose deacetylase (regulator of RNase III)
MTQPKVRVTNGSLTDGTESVLINASNTNGELGSGVSGAIRRACGRGFQDAIFAALDAEFGGPMEPGQVLLTDAGTHPHARFIAHVAVMDYREGFTGSSFPTRRTIELCCERLWPRLETLEPTALSVAMVALGAGTGGLGLRMTTEIACQSLRAHLAATPQSKLVDFTFYGYELPEYLVMVETVAEYFELEPGSVPDEVVAYLKGQQP